MSGVVEETEYIIREMTRIDGRAQRLIVCAVAAAAMLVAGCSGGVFGKVYEYEEDIYLSLDGSADIIVNASAPALAALRGVNLSMDPAVRLDRDDRQGRLSVSRWPR